MTGEHDRQSWRMVSILRGKSVKYENSEEGTMAGIKKLVMIVIVICIAMGLAS